MNTRLIVKNLPKNADEARVREHFKALGDVTDVKVLRTKYVQASSVRWVQLCIITCTYSSGAHNS